jgi:tRNA1Val (adenine37-N6)-methyltransferase
MVHRPRRLVEIFELCRKYNLEPKRMRMVHSYEGADAKMVLIEAVKYGNAQMIVEAPLIIYDEDRKYTKQILEFYGDK